MPVLMPGPTTIGSKPRNLIIEARKECMTFGTTEHTITSSTSRRVYPLICRNCEIITVYSSDVCKAFVVMR